MKKKILYVMSYIILSIMWQLKAADDTQNFIKIAQDAVPAYYKLYIAAKTFETFFAIYEPTDEEPLMKEDKTKSEAHDAWYKRYHERGCKDDPSDPETEKSDTPYYNLFKAKIGSKDKLGDIRKVEITRYRGSGEELTFSSLYLYMPGGLGNYPTFCPFPVDPKDGPALFLYMRELKDFKRAPVTILFGR